MDEEKNKNLHDGDQPGTGDDPGQDPGNDPAPGNDGDTGDVTFTPEQQARIDKIIADRLSRQEEKLKREAKEARRKAEQEAEEARLAEQQEYQQLAEKRGTELDELRPQLESAQEKSKRYEKALKGYVEREMAQVPEFVRPLLEDMDPVEQLEYINAHAEEFGAQGNDGSQGPPKTPKPKGDGDMTETERRRRAVSVRRIWS
jgi:hypothetical protein